jgi:hypothetical protein
MGKNWDWSFEQGKRQRLAAEQMAYQHGVYVPNTLPLHSHDSTMQSYFRKGWFSVSVVDIRIHLGLAKTPQGTDLIQKIRELRSCHFHS